MQVIAVIGDIVDSKAIERRAVFQRRLAAVLETAGDALASPYTITLGDEFQGVYRSAGSLWLDMIEILAAIHPVKARFAIGVGELTTRLNPKQALGMDGPAFHRARAAMTTLKTDGGCFRIEGDKAVDWQLANHTLALISHHLAGWNEKRLQVLAGLLRNAPVSELEAKLRISKVAIYKNINAAALREIWAIYGDLSRNLRAALSQPR